jgi:hypothetical protein
MVTFIWCYQLRVINIHVGGTVVIVYENHIFLDVISSYSLVNRKNPLRTNKLFPSYERSAVDMWMTVRGCKNLQLYNWEIHSFCCFLTYYIHEYIWIYIYKIRIVVLYGSHTLSILQLCLLSEIETGEGKFKNNIFFCQLPETQFAMYHSLWAILNSIC